MSTKLTHLQWKTKMQALHEGQKTPREAIGHSKGWKVDWFAIPCFPDLSSSPTILASHPYSLSFFTTAHPKPTQHLPLHPPPRPLCSQILPTTTFTTSLSPLLNGPLERGHHSEMLLRVIVSSTLKSLLRYHKSLGSFVLKQAEISLESPRIAALSRAGAEEGMWGAVSRTKCPQRTKWVC